MNRRGRPKSSERLRKEDCAALVIRDLPILLRRSGGETITSVDVDGVIAGTRPFRIQLQVRRTKQGWRCLCPSCNRRAMVIYFPPDSVEPACRVCLRLVYECQYDKLPAWASVMHAITEDLRRRHQLSSLTESKPSLS